MGEGKTARPPLSPAELAALVEGNHPDAVEQLLHALEHGPHPHTHFDREWGERAEVPEEWTQTVDLMIGALRGRDVPPDSIAPERLLRLLPGKGVRGPRDHELIHLLLGGQGSRTIERLLRLLASISDQWSWIEAIGGLGESAIGPALVVANQEGEAQGVARRTLCRLVHEGVRDGRIARALVPALRDEDFRVRSAAADALRRIADPEAVPALLRAATDADRGVRSSVAEALGAIRDRRAIPALTALLSDEEAHVRGHATLALGELGAVEPLISALKQGHRDVRYWATQALGKLGDERAVDPLITALQDRDEEVRRGAVDALGKLGDRAVESLAALLKQGEPYLRETAAKALERIGGPEAPPVVNALKEERDIDGLIVALRYEYEKIRSDAVKALSALGDARAVEPLIAALKDESVEVRLDTAEALGELGDSRAVPALIAALGDDLSGVRAFAAQALERIGGPEAQRSLEEFRARP